MDFVLPGRPNKWCPEMYGTRDPFQVPVTFITETEEAVKLIHSLGPGVVAMDTETVFALPVDPFTAKLRVISLAMEGPDGKDVAYVLDVKDMDVFRVGEAFKDRARELGRKRLTVYGFNANFDDPVTTLNLTEQEPGDHLGYRPLLDWVDLMFGVSCQRLGAVGNTWASLAKSADRYLGVDVTGKGGVQLSYDAETPLTEEQVAYAAQDAVVTLWLGDALMDPLEQQNLLETFTLECKARPFLQSMTINGIAFRKEEWLREVEELEQKATEILGQVAEVTGGQATLFGPAVPDFNPDSPDGVRAALNKHCPELVRVYLESRTTNGKLRRPDTLQKYDSADKKTLGLMQSIGRAQEMDTHLVDLLLDYSALSKIQSTYGEKMMGHLRNGRFHSEFTQCQIATGRTSSSKPNAQNFSPLMKPFFRPPDRVDEHGVSHKRVHLQGDYSQAELRVNAQLTGEPVRRKAFAEGEDQHAAVAARMFKVDMAALQEAGDDTSLKRYALFRGKAKTINFGLGYGMAAGLLADTLTLQGVATTKPEAGKLIEDFFVALPQEAAWLKKRDEYVNRIADRIVWGLESGTPISFPLTWRLYNLHKQAKKARKGLGDKKATPEAMADWLLGVDTMSAMSAPSGDRREQLAQDLRWALKYDAPVVLHEDGGAWEFYSRTIANRRRVFQVSAEQLLDKLLFSLARPNNEQFQLEVDKWADANNVQMATNPHTVGPDGQVAWSPNRKPLSRGVLAKQFENNKELRDSFVFSMLRMAYGITTTLPDHRTQTRLSDSLCRSAMANVVGSFANAYRNAPIQGSVADAVLLAFARLFDLLEDFPTAYPVTTVHDSIVLEVDLEDAARIKGLMQECMEDALRHYVPDVRIAADLDVMWSLDSKTGLVDEEEWLNAA